MVSNVDSQASIEGGILIQVLGEISNDGQESRKFAQTFCLAPQEKGYYVYNDIFRFLKEDVDSEFGDDAPIETAASVHQSSAEAEPKVNGTAGKETLFSHEVAAPQQAGAVAPAATSESVADTIPDAHFNGEVSNTVADIEKAAAAPAHDPVELKQEVVPSPVQTPVAPVEEPEQAAQTSAAVEAVAAPPEKKEEASKPSAPMSWAARIAANAKAAVPALAKPAATPKPVAPKAAVVADANERKATPATNPKEADVTRSAFLKNISSKMTDEAIRSALKKFGEFKNVEINRSRSCGFVDFLEPSSCAAAIKHNRVVINGETFLVEERRRDVNGKIGPKEKKYDQNKDSRGGDSTRGGRGGLRGGKSGRGGASPAQAK